MTMTPVRSPRIAANPIPYWSAGGKTREVFETAFSDFQKIGFTAVKADIPEGMTAAEYSEWIAGFGLAPSLSLFSNAFDETIDIDAVVEQAKGFGAAQASLGLDRTMLSSMRVDARWQRPAVGADFQPDRLDRAIEYAGRVCAALIAEGVRPLHHSHIGGIFETEFEITSLLDTLGPDLIGFGPDTGHLRWAGIDPVALMTRYRDRIGGIHIKDVYADYLDENVNSGLNYQQVAETKRLWAEPGLGVLDFAAIVAAMPENYDGDYMIEVDYPSVENVYESHRLSYEWARKELDFAQV